MEVKKSLKELATSAGFEMTVSPTEIEIGEDDLPALDEMMSLTPDHTFFIFLECLLK